MARALASFDDFVGLNVGGLLRTAYMIVWDEQEAEDLVQECLLRLARHWGRVGAMDQPLAYARRALVNLALDDSKRRARRRSELRAALPDSESSPVELRWLDTRDELLQALAQLPLRQRATLVLRYFLDFSEADTAASLGCSVGTVKSNGAKGLARLRELLNDTSPQPEVTGS